METATATASKSGLLILYPREERRWRRICGCFLANRLTAGKLGIGFCSAGGLIPRLCGGPATASGELASNGAGLCRRHRSAIKILERDGRGRRRPATGSAGAHATWHA